MAMYATREPWFRRAAGAGCKESSDGQAERNTWARSKKLMKQKVRMAQQINFRFEERCVLHSKTGKE